MSRFWKRGLAAAGILSILVGVSSTAMGQVYRITHANPLFSVDLGSDMDISDPLGVDQPSEILDCGDIYLAQDQAGPLSYKLYPPTINPLIQGVQAPPLYKDDTAPTGWWQGHPFNPGEAGQPAPSEIGDYQDTTIYETYFDLDAEDQASPMKYDVILPGQNDPQLATVGSLSLRQQAELGIYHMPKDVYLSFEDDGAPGWAVSGNVPTTAAPNQDYEVYADDLSFVPAPEAGTEIANPWASEHNLGLSPNAQGGPATDDDVDALDLHPDFEPSPEPDGFPDFVYDQRFWSPDHEANAGLDPGDIFLTTNTPGQNRVLAFDEGINFGVPDNVPDPDDPQTILDTDVDAFELVSITPEAYFDVFDQQPLDPGGNPIQGLNIVAGLFSVDQDDPDTAGVNESGNLNPKVIYLTNLIGAYAAISDPYEGDIDAISTIPEPSTLLMLLVGLVAFAVRRRRR